jgi:Arc/MetJ family transcription regulator
MRTTININDEILKRASSLTGIKEKTSLVHRALENLIAVESAKRLANLAGSERKSRPTRRRRFRFRPSEKK